MAGYVFGDVANRDPTRSVEEANALLHERIKLPAGYAALWSGQFEAMARVGARVTHILIPIMWTTGTGSDVWKRIAAPMIGGIFSSFAFDLIVYRAIDETWKWRATVKTSLATTRASTSS